VDDCLKALREKSDAIFKAARLQKLEALRAASKEERKALRHARYVQGQLDKGRAYPAVRGRRKTL
jgi:hypothetical protein